jgi:Fe2+ or Zn2+ uptake regulation protein
MSKTSDITPILSDYDKDTILLVLSDKNCRDILAQITHDFKSCLQISENTKIPIVTVYRKINLLKNAKLIDVTGKIDDKKIFYYKSRITEINASYKNNIMSVNVLFKNQV